ncbi:unnamed protein product [Caenorhabditis angaria]|uniref:Uncharacterized protein n=1 Tax=Caenorhabditis angaria TaxID=860376 RepID=A0A9P1N257_9PELO|nr:unnamed protein product [Caenorhabditis angaria]
MIRVSKQVRLTLNYSLNFSFSSHFYCKQTKMVTKIQIVFLLGVVSFVHCIGFKQSVAVKGKLICNDKPATDVRIKMYDKDVLVDTKLDDKTSDSNGEFYLSGGDNEISSIDPRVNIYHDCDDDKYISNGDKPSKVFDLGTIQLAGKWVGETRDCIHRH